MWHDALWWAWRDSIVNLMWLIHSVDLMHSRMCDTADSCMCDMSRSRAWHYAFMCVTWHIHMYDITRVCIRWWQNLYIYVWRDSCAYAWHARCMCHLFICWWHCSYIRVWHDAFVRVMWVIHTCDVTCVCISFDITHIHTCDMTWFLYMCDVTWLIYMCDVTYAWHDRFTCDLFIHWWHWLIYVGCDSFLYTCHDRFMCVTRRILECVVAQSCAWRNLYICVYVTSAYVWLIHVCNTTHSWVCNGAIICVT